MLHQCPDGQKLTKTIFSQKSELCKKGYLFGPGRVFFWSRKVFFFVPEGFFLSRKGFVVSRKVFVLVPEVSFLVPKEVLGDTPKVRLWLLLK